MTQDEIIRMAREAGLVTETHGRDWIDAGFPDDCLFDFAALVAAHEREQLKTPHECQTEGEKTAFAFGWFKATEQIEAAVLAEREACAKVCEERLEIPMLDDAHKMEIQLCAAAIRARSEK